MNWETLAPAFVIIFTAYFIRGITGFGSGLIAVPLLAHLFPLQFVVPFVLVLDFIGSVVLSTGTRNQASWHELKILLPVGLIGVVLGVSLLISLPKEPLLGGLGLFVLAFGIRNVLNIHGSKIISRWWGIPAGLTGGTVSALFGTGGPPYVIYLSHRLQDKSVMRATTSVLFMIEGGARVVAFMIAGLFLQTNIALAILSAIPVMAIGLYLGNKTHIGISQQQILKLIGLLLVVSGSSLLWKAWILHIHPLG
ncbi:sulfite exporter TauE/SafE family protein [Sulfurirhabdus autotrophica]|uniref:Probable membrane transporter protein n=1 Tax=Sulfurirhabdus autotrophica TaxID=1706046 RepID=A0A4R3XXJ8_9PROT|nr:sulfite exporter TauE/SafE family protein [Sulfurirhabdus autotrophica]TCV82988.1 hypothetical protein EDC63_11723 [Sulfurirhabdus autotrophica]